jgi:hypothetical protein
MAFGAARSAARLLAAAIVFGALTTNSTGCSTPRNTAPASEGEPDTGGARGGPGSGGAGSGAAANGGSSGTGGAGSGGNQGNPGSPDAARGASADAADLASPSLESCDPKAPPTCANETLRICRADGTGFVATTCPIGCREDGSKCNPCASWQHACPKHCTEPDDPDRCGDSCTACPIVANAPRMCVDNRCVNACPPGQTLCQGGTGCQARAWDFESDTIGWLPQRKPLRERGTLPALVAPVAQMGPETEDPYLGSGRAHDGRLSYTLPIRVTAEQSRIVARHEFCGTSGVGLGSVDLGATGLSAWFFLEVTKGNFVSAHCSAGGFAGRKASPTDFSFAGEVDLRPGQWVHLLAANPNPQNTFTETLWVSCDVLGEFEGTFYMDDVRLTPAR